MRLDVLGAHQTDTLGAHSVAFVLDGVLALDAGGLCAGLSLADQRALKALLLTHQHVDHCKDLPGLALNVANAHPPALVDVYLLPETQLAVCRHLFNGVLWFTIPVDGSANRGVRFVPVRPDEAFQAAGYAVRALTVFHSVPAVGYEVKGPDGRTLFYTGDTGNGLGSVWAETKPDLLLIECTYPARLTDEAMATRHLSTRLLRAELEAFHAAQGHLPRVLAVHVNVEHEDEIGAELAAMAVEFGADISAACEGMRLDV